MKLKLCLLLNIIFFTFSFTNAANTLDAANKLYQQKSYSEAKDELLSLLKNDKHNASIYYNLGNCYFQLKDYTLAILYYEKALKIAPNNEAIQHNLHLANQKGLKKNEHSADFFLFQWATQLHQKHTSRYWSISFLICFFLFSILSFIYFRKRENIYLKLSILLLCFSIILFYMAKQKFYLETSITHAIVMHDSDMVNKPSLNAKKVGTISSGNKVKLLDHDGNFYKIKTVNNKIVWIDKENIATI